MKDFPTLSVVQEVSVETMCCACNAALGQSHKCFSLGPAYHASEVQLEDGHKGKDWIIRTLTLSSNIWLSLLTNSSIKYAFSMRNISNRKHFKVQSTQKQDISKLPKKYPNKHQLLRRSVWENSQTIKTSQRPSCASLLFQNLSFTVHCVPTLSKDRETERLYTVCPF